VNKQQDRIGPARVLVGRVYDPPTEADGIRVLVDRLWPRGMTKDRAALDEWCKDVAPSHELRRWYGHDPERTAEFARRYCEELAGGEQSVALAHLREISTDHTVTLLTSTKDPVLSHLNVLIDLLSGDHASKNPTGSGVSPRRG